MALLTRKEIFLKAWWWSLIGSVVISAIFWIFAGSLHFFQGELERFTISVLCASLVGDILGASLIAWRVADKYYHARLHKSLRRYAQLSLLSLAIAIGLLFTPASLLVGFWSLVSAWCVMLALAEPKKTNP